MTGNLNENLYKQFGLELDRDKVEKGFKLLVRDSFVSELNTVIHPDHYKEPDDLYKRKEKLVRRIWRELFLDYGDDWEVVIKAADPFNDLLNDEFTGTFQEYLVRLQIILNVLYDSGDINGEMVKFNKAIIKYLTDYPLLGVTIKTYKTRPPKILPTASKIFTQYLDDTLNILDEEEYSEVSKHFDDGITEFLKAKTQGDLKDVVEDMYTASDTVVAIVNGSKVGLRNLFIGKIPLDLGLDKWQLEIFNTMRDRMDKIKHGVNRTFTEPDVEEIILLSSMFIRSVIAKRVNGKK